MRQTADGTSQISNAASQPSESIGRAAFVIITAFTYAVVPPQATGDALELDQSLNVDHLRTVEETIAELLRVASSWT